MFLHLKTIENVQHYCLELVNLINAMYAPLNVFVVLTGVVVWSIVDEFEVMTDGSLTLDAFAKYRRETLVAKYPNDIAQLLTRTTFKNNVVGKYVHYITDQITYRMKPYPAMCHLAKCVGKTNDVRPNICLRRLNAGNVFIGGAVVPIKKKVLYRSSTEPGTFNSIINSLHCYGRGI